MHHITREELASELEAGTVRLIMPLGGWAFAAGHIPGALHLEGPRAALAALGLGEPVVVHGCDAHCPAGIAAYRQLVRHGFRHVRRYAGGLTDWTAAGRRLEGVDPHGPTIDHDLDRDRRRS